ncbi:hypothetical protein KM043_013496 [Ampulex compressa]|nr:hypothetical protein KM043_013496 [Ampulex compressa]
MTIGGRSFLIIILTASLAAGEIRNKNWWQHTVFYQIYPRSFMDSDGDGVGDLKGITEKLDHFVNSGVGAIWLSPINTSPMVDFGYDISDFEDIDNIFGTLTDFENLLAEAKKRGLKVVLDLVPNHTSDEHHWFQKSVQKKGKYKDYYIWSDGKMVNGQRQPPNNWISVFGGPAWTLNSTRGQYYFHQFHPKQPDLNYRNPTVQEEMKRVIEYWLEKGVDGFRIDAVPHLFESDINLDEPRTNKPNVGPAEYEYLNHILTKDLPETYDLVQSWRNISDTFADTHNQEEKVIMTEAYTSLVNTTRFYNHGSHVPFNFNFIMAVNSSSPVAEFKRIIDDWMAAKPPSGTANWVMGNHDRKRTATRYPGMGDEMTMLAMILPGVAVTYYGEEIGMLDKDDISYEDTQDPQGIQAGRAKYKEKSRDGCRTPFQWDNSKNAGFSNATKTWLPVNTNQNTLNLKAQNATENSHYKVYQSLTKMRSTRNSLKNGDTHTGILDETVLLVVRNDNTETTSLLINFSNATKSVQLPSNITNSVVALVGQNKNATIQNNTISLTPKTGAVILSALQRNQNSGAVTVCLHFVLILLSVLCVQY